MPGVGGIEEYLLQDPLEDVGEEKKHDSVDVEFRLEYEECIMFVLHGRDWRGIGYWSRFDSIDSISR